MTVQAMQRRLHTLSGYARQFVTTATGQVDCQAPAAGDGAGHTANVVLLSIQEA